MRLYKIVAMSAGFCIFSISKRFLAALLWKLQSENALCVFPPAVQNKLLSVPPVALTDCSIKCFPNVYTLCINCLRLFIKSEVGVSFSMNAREEVKQYLPEGRKCLKK